MNILAPIDNVSEVKLYSVLGVDEIYCGYVPSNWKKTYNNKVKNWTNKDLQLSLNRREIGFANITLEEDMIAIVKNAHSLGMKVFVTVNAPSYPQNTYEFIINYIASLVEYKVDGLIVSDIGLIRKIKEKFNIKVMLSTCNQVSSVEGVKFLKEVGVDRIVFPRHVDLKDIARITKEVPDMEYECFLLEGKCVYDDGNCNILHSCGSFCSEKWITRYYDENFEEVEQESQQMFRKNEADYQRYTTPYINTDRYENGWRNNGCGVCALPYIMENTNISSIKIAGRGIDECQKIKNISILKKAIKMAEGGSNRTDIMSYMKKEVQPYPELCDDGYRCYYPEAKKLD
ncbi:U32 family peptidase [uncultured Clostridium sp.]|uniref:peptidase U32 family protein n=1 Tax=uncultured Clostridium sp. TaxID=59620 RepID=UPI0025FAC2C3|nr:U32 family peptidase [uncultured Clostridium sp.]